MNVIHQDSSMCSGGGNYVGPELNSQVEGGSYSV